ncbi:MAG: glycosyltransferase [Litoreibacter sp.]|nr:glycosyltransferase [Litoreibacter sp.]MCY4336552.1 glycosyltransferase [Litoreibacter sp.]
MHLLYQTRFSYLGQSGWQSEASKDETLLFAPERMQRRFELFEKITLASLKAQSDPEFKLILLTSSRMPDQDATLLAELTQDMLGGDRVEILSRAPRMAGRVFRGHVQDRYAAEEQLCQVVLDDDDALSLDFTEVCRREAIRALETDYDGDPSRFLSFARGANMLLEEGQPIRLSDKYTPMVNLGLALASRADTEKHPYLTHHLAIGQNHPSVIINTLRPFYLRTIHDQNDSRTPHKTNWMGPEEVAQVLDYFPFMRPYFDLAEDTAA